MSRYLVISILVAVLVAIGLVANQPVAADGGYQWSCVQRPWVVADRMSTWSGETATLGQSLPGSLLATVGMDNDIPMIRLWLYDGTDDIFGVDYGALWAEDGSSINGDNFRPVGTPALVVHGGMLKIMGQTSDGKLYRIYTFCYVEEH